VTRRLPPALSGLLLLLFLIQPGRAGDALPRYHFTPGQQLTYQGSSKFTFTNGSFTTTTTVVIWVTGQNPDDSWHLLSKCDSTMHRTDNNSQFNEPDDQRTSWSSADVSPDGRVDHVESTDAERGSIPYVSPLPKNEAELKAGWRKIDGATGEGNAYAVIPAKSTADVLAIRDVHTTESDAIYLLSDSSEVLFDRAKGLIVHSDDTGTQGYGFVGRIIGTTDLKNVGTVDPAKLKQLDDNFHAYLPLHKEWMAACTLPGLSSAGVAAAGEKEKAFLLKARSDLTLPEFQALLDKDIAEIPEVVTEEQREAQQQATLLHAPATDWKTTDLKGNARALADFRGKVVVLDFWYRGCGWCMLAMPQVKEVAAHFAGRPVVVLGMSTDTPESKDADFVAQKMALPYPTLYAKDIARAYGIQGFPTLLILDQTGAVKSIDVGYSSTLRDGVERKVEALLGTAR
jgi:thiol-disulfide isomerase/thioredoxin